MSKFAKLLAGVVVAVGLAAAAPQAALAQHHGGGGWHGGGGGWHGGGGGWHGGGWRGGGWHGGGGWGWGGFGPGFALGFGLGAVAPYYAAPYPYYYGGDCGWVRERYWRYGYWHIRRVWRCW